MNTQYENVSHAIPDLARRILASGDEVGTRQGGRALELLHQEITLTNPTQRAVVTPGRKTSLPAQIAEAAWVLAGRNDIGWLTHYLPRAAEFSDDGNVWRGGYGPRLRAWESRTPGDVVDQLAHVVRLLRDDPLTRRATMTIYDPEVDTKPGKDVPCNNWLTFSSRKGYLHLHVATRSNDLIWGWSGVNAFEWSVLQEVVAGLLGVRVGHLHFSITSLHVYEHHWARAQKLSEVEALPTFAAAAPAFDAAAAGHSLEGLDGLLADWFVVEERLRTNPRSDSVIFAVANFPEPMLRSWLHVLGWWWSGDTRYLRDLQGTALHAAALASPGRKVTIEEADARAETLQDVLDRVHPTPKAATWAEETRHEDATGVHPQQFTTPFVTYVSLLHEDKSKAYGDSWKRRGEMLGIMANIARKVDRLGVSGGGDTSTDTAIDLLVYLVKYHLWLHDEATLTPTGDENARVEHMLAWLDTHPLREPYTVDQRVARLRAHFEDLERAVTTHPEERGAVVGTMLDEAFALADYLWHTEG